MVTHSVILYSKVNFQPEPYKGVWKVSCFSFEPLWHREAHRRHGVTAEGLLTAGVWVNRIVRTSDIFETDVSRESEVHPHYLAPKCHRKPSWGWFLPFLCL